MKIVMFSQTWCGPCKQLKPHLEAAAKQLGYEVEVRNIDTDDNTDWSRYGIEHTPTVFVLEDNGAVIARLETTDPLTHKPNAIAIKQELEQYV